MCVCIHILFNYGLSQDIVYRPCCLFILYIIICVCEFQTPRPYPTLPTLWQSQVYSLRTWIFKVFNSCSVTKLCLTFCDPMDCNRPGFPVLHYVPEFAQTHVSWVGDAIQPSHPVTPFSSCPQSFPASRASESALRIRWPKYWPPSASASVLPMNIQDWFSLALTCLISLLSKGLSRVFSSTCLTLTNLENVMRLISLSQLCSPLAHERRFWFLAMLFLAL